MVRMVRNKSREGANASQRLYANKCNYYIPDAPIWVAQRMMSENRIRHLPVVEKGELVGMLTEGRIRELVGILMKGEPAKESARISTKTVKEFMEREVVTASPNDLLGTAVALGSWKEVGSIVVVDKGNKVVGILTSTDVLKLLIKSTAVDEPGVRVRLTKGSKDLPKALEVLVAHKAPICTIFRVPVPKANRTDITIRLEPCDVTKITDELRAQGCTVEVTME